MEQTLLSTKRGAFRDHQETDGTGFLFKDHPSYTNLHFERTYMKENGSAPPSLVSNALSELQENPKGCDFTEEEVMNTAASTYEGTYPGVSTFLLRLKFRIAHTP